MVYFTLPVFSDVDLIHVSVHDALPHRFNVVFMRFIGVRDGLPMRLGWRHGDWMPVPFTHVIDSGAPVQVVSKHLNCLSAVVHCNTAVNAPQDCEYSPFIRGVLEAQRLSPLNQIVGECARPKWTIWDTNRRRLHKGLLGGLCLQFNEQISEVFGTERDAMVPRTVFPLFHFGLQNDLVVDQPKVALQRSMRLGCRQLLSQRLSNHHPFRGWSSDERPFCEV